MRCCQHRRQPSAGADLTAEGLPSRTPVIPSAFPGFYSTARKLRPGSHAVLSLVVERVVFPVILCGRTSADILITGYRIQHRRGRLPELGYRPRLGGACTQGRAQDGRQNGARKGREQDAHGCPHVAAGEPAPEPRPEQCFPEMDVGSAADSEAGPGAARGFNAAQNVCNLERRDSSQ